MVFGGMGVWWYGRGMLQLCGHVGHSVFLRLPMGGVC